MTSQQGSQETGGTLQEAVRCRWCRRPLPVKEGPYWLDDRGRYECPSRVASAHKPRIRDLAQGVQP